MFQTKFDRWLVEHLVYEHHIKVVRLPEKLPRGVKVKDIRSQQYNHVLVVKKQKTAERLIEQLTDNGAVFSTRVADGSHWYNVLINNKKKSFSFRVFWWIVMLIISGYAFQQLTIFMKSETFYEAKDSLQQLLSK